MQGRGFNVSQAHIHTHIHIYTYTYTRLHAPCRAGASTSRKHTYIYTYTHIYIYIYTHIHIHAPCRAGASTSHKHTYIYTYTHIYIYIYTQLHIYIPVYIYTHPAGPELQRLMQVAAAARGRTGARCAHAHEPTSQLLSELVYRTTCCLGVWLVMIWVQRCMCVCVCIRGMKMREICERSASS